MSTFLEYMDAAMGHARYATLSKESGSIYVHIPGFESLWAMGSSMEEARAELYMALDIWLTIKFVVRELDPPDMGGQLRVD